MVLNVNLTFYKLQFIITSNTGISGCKSYAILTYFIFLNVILDLIVFENYFNYLTSQVKQTTVQYLQ